MSAGPVNKKKVRIEIFEVDLPILAAFSTYLHSEDAAEGLHYAFKLMAELTDRIKEQDDYINGKKEAWKQAQMRKNLPFYG